MIKEVFNNREKKCLMLSQVFIYSKTMNDVYRGSSKDTYIYDKN